MKTHAPISQTIMHPSALLRVGLLLTITTLFWSSTPSTQASEKTHQIGVGAHYWRAVENIDDDYDKDGLAYYLTYQWKPSLVGLGIDIERKKAGFGGSSDDVYEPQAYLIFGEDIYAAAGIGGYITDGKLENEPFYLFRVGLDLVLIEPLHIDIHGDYRFENWGDLSNDDKDIDTDTITLGAALRLAF